MRRTGLLLFVALLGLVFSFGEQETRAQSQALYDIVDLGSLGGTITEALDMNESGLVTGTSRIADDATGRTFVYIPGVGMTAPGTIGDADWGVKINAAGQVMGRYHLGSGMRTFIYIPGTGMSDIGVLALDQVIGLDMNASGQITGQALMSEGDYDGHHIMTYHAFLYSPWTGIVDLDPWGGGGPSGRSSAINDFGQVAGTINAPTGSFPFVYTPGVGTVNINPYPYSGGGANDINNNGWATGSFSDTNGTRAFLFTGSGMTLAPVAPTVGQIINEAGQIVAISGTRDRPNYACFLWTNDAENVSSFVGLGNLGSEYCVPTSMNHSGHIVGMSKLADGSRRAFLYKDGALHDLSSLIPGDSGWILEVAMKINNRGWITGYTHHNGETRSYLLIPKNPPIGYPVTPVDKTTGTIPLEVDFTNPSGGETTLITSTTGPALPGGFKLGAPPVYYNLETTLTYSPPAGVCIYYSPASFGSGALRLLHYENGAWVDRTTGLGRDMYDRSFICARVDSFSPFVVAEGYTFTGFFAPIENGRVNSVKAGSAVPMKFSLGVDRGLAVLSALPTSYPIGCSSSEPADPVEETVTVGASSLSYDSTSEQYVYIWKTDKLWAGTCRQFVMTLSDGTPHTANFKFTK